MGLFDKSTISSQDVSNLKQKQVLPFIIGRQIDRILARSGEIYSSQQASLGPTVASLKNMRTQLLFLSRFLEPYIRREMLPAINYSKKTRLPAPHTIREVDDQVEQLGEAFAGIVDSLGRIGMLPPIEKDLESAGD